MLEVLLPSISALDSLYALAVSSILAFNCSCFSTNISNSSTSFGSVATYAVVAAIKLVTATVINPIGFAIIAAVIAVNAVVTAGSEVKAITPNPIANVPNAVANPTTADVTCGFSETNFDAQSKISAPVSYNPLSD